MLVYFLFVNGDGHAYKKLPTKAIIATPNYEHHVKTRRLYIEDGYMVSTKTREMTDDEWNSVSDIS